MTVAAFDNSGRIKTPTADEYRQADEEVAIIAYTNGQMADGRPYYAYVAVKPSKYKEFYTKCAAKQPIVLGDYGPVIEGGFTETPPAEVKERMRKLGFDEQMEEKLTLEAKKQLAAFMERQEVERIQGIVAMIRRDGKAE